MEKQNYDVIASLQAASWWYEARRDLLRRKLSTFPPIGVAVDVGCGVGANLPVLEQFADSVLGIDPSPEAVRWSAGRGSSRVVLGDVDALELDDESVDLVTCLDVLEHVPDDRTAMCEIRRVLRPGGLLMVTVPAHPHLWNDNDDFSHHVRRYRKRELVELLSDYQVMELGYWNAVSYFPMVLYSSFRRMFPARRATNNLQHVPGLLSAPLRWLVVLENRLRNRIPPWTGTSLMAIARRPDRARGGVASAIRQAGGESR